MQSNSTPFKKRNNPFADIGSSTPAPTPVAPVVQEEVKPVVQQKKVVDDSNREKYTATMEKSLRKRVIRKELVLKYFPVLQVKDQHLLQ